MEENLRCWAEVDLDIMQANVQEIKSRLSAGCRLMAVVKANAYGHGDLGVARRLQAMGADWLGVATFEEGRHLRQGGVTLPILVLGYTPAEAAPELVRLGLVQTVYSAQYAKALAGHLSAKEQLEVHLKIDSGMHRLGLDTGMPESLEEAKEVYGMPGLHCTGIYTHFAVADEREGEGAIQTEAQFSGFQAFCQALAKTGVQLGLRHCCNSAATLLYPQMHLDMVRCGIVLYGLRPSRDLIGAAPLEPVLSLHARIVQLRQVTKGEAVSYGRIYIADGEKKIAVVSIGYADGYQRQLGNRAVALVHGVAVPVVGRVCMDQLMLDVTSLPEVKEGDEVTLVGRSKNRQITFDDLADLTGTIGYERICAVSIRVRRIYRWEGRKDCISSEGTGASS